MDGRPRNLVLNITQKCIHPFTLSNKLVLSLTDTVFCRFPYLYSRLFCCGIKGMCTVFLTDNDYPELLQKNKQSRILHVDLDPSYHDFQGAWKNHSQLSLNDLLKRKHIFQNKGNGLWYFSGLWSIIFIITHTTPLEIVTLNVSPFQLTWTARHTRRVGTACLVNRIFVLCYCTKRGRPNKPFNDIWFRRETT